MTEVDSTFMYNMVSSEFKTMFKDEKKYTNTSPGVNTLILLTSASGFLFSTEWCYFLASCQDPAFVDMGSHCSWSQTSDDGILSSKVKRTAYPRTQVVTHQEQWHSPGFWQLRGTSWSCIVPCRQSPFSSLVGSQSWGCASSYKQASYPPLASECNILQKSTWNESLVSMAISSLVLVF